VEGGGGKICKVLGDVIEGCAAATPFLGKSTLVPGAQWLRRLTVRS